MRITIDTEKQTIHEEDHSGRREVPLYSADAFSILSDLWLKVGWVAKYIYSFSWMGRPIIQLPDDLIRIQEVIYRVKPDVVIETGVAHGGSLVFYASLFKAMGKGRVIGVDIDVRAHNRQAIEAHELKPLIDIVEGSSIATDTLSRVRALLRTGDTVLVLLDSDHSRAHVAAELEAYGPMVTPGSYIVSTDGIMEMLHDAPRGKPEWKLDNPATAADEYLTRHPEFKREEPPPFPFNEGQITRRVTHWPRAFLKRG